MTLYSSREPDSCTDPEDTQRLTGHMSEYIYDQLPYTSRAFPATHPRNLAAVAYLRGMEPAPMENCRVLELGCASGGNLFPMAAHYPQSRFLGIDNSRREIDDGLALGKRLGLRNIDLRAMDIMDIDESLGEFDYIIVHGVYSWVPDEVRQRILEICSRQLSPNGIAYISYNVLPGWHLYGTARDIMRYAVRDFDDTHGLERKVQTACEWLSTLTEILPAEKNPYIFQLRAVAKKITSSDPSYLLHEYLAEINNPYHFHEFINDIRKFRLRYVGDAATLGYGIVPSAALDKRLAECSRDVMDFEQRADFLLNREFRCALLCRTGVTLGQNLMTDRLGPLYLSSMARHVPLPRQRFGDTIGFQFDGDVYINPHPLFQQAMRHLTEAYPDAMTFSQLLNLLQCQGGDAEVLAMEILRARSGGIVSITLDKPRLDTSLAPRPVADTLAQKLCSITRQIPTPWHTVADLDDFILLLLPCLDGTRDHDAQLNYMREKLADRTTLFGVAPAPAPDTHERERWLTENLTRSLEFLRRAGLLKAA